MLKHIKDKLFDCDIFICTGMKFNNLVPMIKKKFNVNLKGDEIEEESNLSVDGISIELTTGWLVWVLNSKNKSVIIHELMHITQHILETRKIFLSKETKEIYAYYIGFLTREVFK